MRFKAIILNCVNVITDGYPTPLRTPFIFTKRKVLFSKKHGEKIYHLTIPLGCPFQTGSDYELRTEYDKEDKKRFVIEFNYNMNCKSYLKINWYNRFKLNWIHKRYLIHRDPDFFWKTLFSAFIGFLFGLIGIIAGYRQGYQNGIKTGKAQSQDTLKQVSK